MRLMESRNGRLSLGTVLLGILLLAGLVWAAGEVLSIQVRTGQLRSKPSFLGAKVSEVEYGAQVTVQSRRGPWAEVQDENGKKGWIHESALSENNLVLSSGSVEASSGASSEEVALAGKGFNEQVEKEYRKKNGDLDYSWVDRMQGIEVSAEEAQEFLSAGQVEPKGGF